MALKVPTKNTLKKYGLTQETWTIIAERQGWVCFVCKMLPKSERLHVDHEHVKGWKKMEPAKRLLAVRGLLCFRCNTTYVGRSITVDRARRVMEYLIAHQNRSGG